MPMAAGRLVITEISDVFRTKREINTTPDGFFVWMIQLWLSPQKIFAKVLVHQGLLKSRKPRVVNVPPELLVENQVDAEPSYCRRSAIPANVTVDTCTFHLIPKGVDELCGE